MDFSPSLKAFKVIVRLKNENEFFTTTLFYDSLCNLRSILLKFFRSDDVVSVSEIVSSAPQIAQIQREAAFSPILMHRQAQTQKIAQIQPSQDLKQRKRQVSSLPIAAPIKHQIVQNRLTKQLMRQSNIVKPTTDDFRIAKNRAETALKRADLEFKRQTDEQLRRHEREKRRRLAKPNDV